MEVAHKRTERFYLKLLLGCLIGIVLLIAVCWGGHDVYVRWQERRLVRRAVVAIQKGDDITASVAARAVLQIKPTSAGAARIMAQLAEKTGNRAALDWRHKVIDAEPHSVEDALALARSALQFNEPTVAEQALGGIDEKGKQEPGYHAVVATLADLKKDDKTAIREWEQAVQMDPNEPAYQLQLGIVQLRCSNGDEHVAGKALLNKLRADPKQATAATRALINDGVARRESGQELTKLAAELQSYPDATIADRLIYLDFLHQLNDPEFTHALSELEGNVISNPTDLGALLEWMSRSGMNMVALDYIKTVPAEVLKKWPIPLAIAEIYERLNDWPKLEDHTKNTNWGPGEFIRHAFLARTFRAQDKQAAAEREWAAAVKESSGQSSQSMALMRTTAEWNWEKEMVDLLWSLTKNPEKQKEAIQELYRYYERADDTQGIYRVLVRWQEMDPNDLNVQNNLAQISLLLDANADDARRVAADLYKKAPSNATYATTYAFSLLTKNNPKDAVKVLNSLTPEQLSDPAVSAYYGICLAAVHDEKSREYLAAGKKAPLLPEEKKLVDKALASMDSWRRIR